MLDFYLGSTFSVCGDCGCNASLDEESHYTEPPRGVGCGVKWRYVTNDKGASAEAVQRMRPNLEYRRLDQSVSGITEAVERAVIHDALSPHPERN